MNFVYFTFVVTASLLCGVKCENFTLAELEERAAIVNGYNAPNRPFYVEVLVNGQFACGGTIIKKNFVLTAAHCFLNGYRSVAVSVGDFSNPNSKKTTIPARVKVNPGFKGPPNYHNDVAVLKLSQTVSSSKALPLCTKDYSRYTILVCGMGETIGDNIYSLAKRLQETKLMETSSCGEFDRWPVNFDKSEQICLGPIKGQSPTSACSGDSGSAAYPDLGSGNVPCVYGIASYVTTKPMCGGNSVYTRVSAWANWIQQTMRYM